jgi:hypothetical protein|tara:strand:- start:215 stop:409 length:195 start_codon:yes stop_codon:yes gene_type:complete
MIDAIDREAGVKAETDLYFSEYSSYIIGPAELPVEVYHWQPAAHFLGYPGSTIRRNLNISAKIF